MGELENSEDHSVKAHESLLVASNTDVGMKREENQDSYGFIETEFFRLCIVADGMGGVQGGAIASQLAIKVIKENLEGEHKITRKNLSAAVLAANKAIYNQGEETISLRGMGTTLVALCFIDDKLCIVNVGDSRAYKIKSCNRIEQLTEDHTLVNELVKTGALHVDQVENHPVSHMLTRSLGPASHVEVDCYISEDAPRRGERYLLCSDGLYNLVTDKEISLIAMEYEPQEAVDKLIDLANERGGSDNITIIIVEAGSGYEEPLEEEEDEEDKRISVADTIEFEKPIVLVKDNGDVYVNGVAHSPGAFDSQKPLNDSDLEEDRDFSDTLEDVIPIATEDSVKFWKKPSFLMMMCSVAAFACVFSYYVGYRHSQQTQIAVVKDNTIKLPVIKKEVLEKEVLIDKQKSEVLSDNLVENKIKVVKPRSLKVDIVPNGSIEEQYEFVSDKIKEYDLHLLALDGQALEEVEQEKITNKEEMVVLEQERSTIESQVDLATRKLAVWYGRQKRLESTDEIRMAEEVSAFSDFVKESKSEFEKATWRYLKAKEQSQYDPQNSSQREEVKRLVDERKEKLTSLTADVRSAISKEINSAQRAILEFSRIRDDLDAKIVQMQDKLDFYSLVTDGSEYDKEIMRVELRRKISDFTKKKASMQSKVLESQKEEVYTEQYQSVENNKSLDFIPEVKTEGLGQQDSSYATYSYSDE